MGEVFHRDTDTDVRIVESAVEARHSGSAIASFVIAFAVGGIDIILAIFTASNIAGSGTAEDAATSAVAGLFSIFCFGLLTIPVCLVGIALGLVGMISGRRRKVTFEVLGLGGNTFLILAAALFWVWLTAIRR